MKNTGQINIVLQSAGRTLSWNGLETVTTPPSKLFRAVCWWCCHSFQLQSSLFTWNTISSLFLCPWTPLSHSSSRYFLVTWQHIICSWLRDICLHIGRVGTKLEIKNIIISFILSSTKQKRRLWCVCVCVVATLYYKKMKADHFTEKPSKASPRIKEISSYVRGEEAKKRCLVSFCCHRTAKMEEAALLPTLSTVRGSYSLFLLFNPSVLGS